MRADRMASQRLDTEYADIPGFSIDESVFALVDPCPKRELS
jgi:hypothetical protein